MLVKRKLQIFVSNKKRHFHAANLRLKPILLFYCASLNHNVQLIAPIYFSLCMKQGMGLLENSLYRQFVQHNNVLLKQWEGMIELLGSESKPVGGLEFLHKYKDFKESLQKVSGGKSTELASNGRSCTVNTIFWNTIQLLFPQEIEARKVVGSLNSEQKAQKLSLETIFYANLRNTSIQPSGGASSINNSRRVVALTTTTQEDEDVALAIRFQRNIDEQSPRTT
ncbi:nuclear pore complex protein NUP85-like isoform X2 [Vigna unguiculata]|uniref:nuclear pore complex protein NUP85-like isoform X2 n=1 Tax=Vigna unguiculata TaxID=3917 RepID=UPI001015EF07|nr:nuclear pore complex protein NUP85-like isoform X2 [Vigna unguiculata]